MALTTSVLSRRFSRPFWNRPFGCLTSPPWKVKQANAFKRLWPPCSQTTAHCVLYHPKHPKSSSGGEFLSLLLFLIFITYVCSDAEIYVFLSNRLLAVMMEIFIQTTEQLVVFIAAGGIKSIITRNIIGLWRLMSVWSKIQTATSVLMFGHNSTSGWIDYLFLVWVRL